MKFSILSSVFGAAALTATSVAAGGFIAPVVDPEPVVVVEAPAVAAPWTGAYVGGTLGYALAGDDRVGVGEPAADVFSPGTLELSGVNGGLRLGYRQQMALGARNWVVGAELGYEMGSIEDSFESDGYEAAAEVNNVLGLRLKAGLPSAAGDMLYYGIAGVVRADYDYRVEGTGPGGAIAVNEEGLKDTGYVIGLGVERMMSDRMSLTGEWEYANFGKRELGDTTTTQATVDYHNLKLGINFRF